MGADTGTAVLELYGGKVRLEFGEKDHKYLVSKLVKDDLWTIPSPVLGVTTICGVISKPALMTYPMNKALEYLKTRTEPLSDLDYRQARQAHIDHSNAGKKAGKVGHALIEALLTGKTVKLPTDKELKAQIESVQNVFNEWVEDFSPKILGTEQAVYSLLYDYAGTYDLLAEIDGKKYICDFKTTSPSYYNPDGIYAEYYCQLGGYLIAYEEQNEAEVDGAMIVNLPKDGSEYKVKGLEDIGKTMTDAKCYFLHALGLFNSNRDFN